MFSFNTCSEIIGAVYLHTNGEMIYKPYATFANCPDYFSSSFFKKVWYIEKKGTDEEAKEMVNNIIEEAKSLGANPDKVSNWVEPYNDAAPK